MENGYNRPFWSFLLALGQSESSHENIHAKMCSACMFTFMPNEAHFHTNVFLLKTRFEKEAQGYLEMAYSL